jgi:hypothetical protein
MAATCAFTVASDTPIPSVLRVHAESDIRYTQVELVLKFTIDRLVAGGVLPSAPPRNHDIEAHWKILHDAHLGDEKLRQCVRGLEPFIASLSRIDDDGEELRYHPNRDEGKSLSTYSLANLEVIRDSLVELSKIISTMTYRTIDFLDERGTGAFTNRLSRRDLMEIAKLMPPLDRWKEVVFDEKKEIVKFRFGLSNNQFSKALNVIKGKSGDEGTPRRGNRPSAHSRRHDRVGSRSMEEDSSAQNRRRTHHRLFRRQTIRDHEGALPR